MYATNEWIKKMWNITQPLEKKKVLSFATIWIDFESIIRNGITQTNKENHYVISQICEI